MMYYFTYIHTGEMCECYTKSLLKFIVKPLSLKVRKIKDFREYLNDKDYYWKKLLLFIL